MKDKERECKEGEEVMNLLSGHKYKFIPGRHSQDLHVPTRIFKPKGNGKKDNRISST